jgi:hypothetical protein
MPARKRRGLIEIELGDGKRASALTRMSTLRRWGGSSMF